MNTSKSDVSATARAGRARCRFQVKASEGAAAGTFAGYGAVFDNVDWYGDTIRKGAFRDSLSEWGQRGKLPKMLSQHGGWGIGADDMTPIGQWTSMLEDDVGLRCEGRLFALETDRGKLLYEAIVSGELDGLSIGYDPIAWENGSKPEEPRRVLTKIKLWEVSPVTFPANPAALIDEAKRAAGIRSAHDFEHFLRSAGFPKALAKSITAHGFKTAAEQADVDPDAVAEIVRKLDAQTARLNPKGI